ncbi:hypothetical protein J3E69DRAFT_41682 [Trichoderma sp. SZMC 28015]
MFFVGYKSVKLRTRIAAVLHTLGVFSRISLLFSTRTRRLVYAWLISYTAAFRIINPLLLLLSKWGLQVHSRIHRQGPIRAYPCFNESSTNRFDCDAMQFQQW